MPGIDNCDENNARDTQASRNTIIIFAQIITPEREALPLLHTQNLIELKLTSSATRFIIYYIKENESTINFYIINVGDKIYRAILNTRTVLFLNSLFLFCFGIVNFTTADIKHVPT